MTQLRNFFAGEWVEGDDVLRNVNPSNLADVVGEYALADEEDAERAVRAASDAFPGWALASPQERFDALDKIGTELLQRREEIARLLAREEGKTLAEARLESKRAGEAFKFFAGEAVRVGGERMPSVRPGVDVEILREPVGVVGVITPWNFPIAIPAWKVASALAYGNCVVFKPAELVPGCAWVLAEVISRAGLPPGAFNMVIGAGEVGAAIVGSPHVAAVTFTGSTEVGKQIALSAVEHGAKLQLEMGGKNPLVVLDDADLSLAVDAAVASAYGSSGQRCTASSRLIATEGIHDRFVDALTERLGSMRVGDALADDTDLGPVVSQEQLDQDLEYLKIGEGEGAKLALRGERLARETEGYYLSPALFTESTNDMRINREEIFGPIASVIRVRGYEEALEVANETVYGLSSGIMTSSLKHAEHFKKHSKSGVVMVNLPTVGVDYHVPFGGVKGSSYGPRELGSNAREFFTTTRTTYTAPGA